MAARAWKNAPSAVDVHITIQYIVVPTVPQSEVKPRTPGSYMIMTFLEIGLDIAHKRLVVGPTTGADPTGRRLTDPYKDHLAENSAPNHFTARTTSEFRSSKTLIERDLDNGGNATILYRRYYLRSSHQNPQIRVAFRDWSFWTGRKLSRNPGRISRKDQKTEN